MSTRHEIMLKGTVRNGRFQFSRPKLAESVIEGLEGKKFEMTLEEEKRYKTTSQLGYYFGGIIRNTCMKAELFAGWEFDEIDNFFRRRFLSYKKELVRYIRVKGKNRKRKFVVSANVTEPLEDADTTKMALFITKVIAFLDMEGIHVLNADEYKLRKYSQVREE